MTTDTATTAEPIDPLPLLVGAIVDAHLAATRGLFEALKAGERGDALMARAEANRAAIIVELVEPNGEAGAEAWEEAVVHLTRLADLLRDEIGRGRRTENAGTAFSVDTA